MTAHSQPCTHGYTDSQDHRRTSQGAAAPLTRTKPLFFGQKLNLSGRSQQAKMKKNLHLLNEKTELIPSKEIKVPEIRDFYTNNYWVG